MTMEPYDFVICRECGEKFKLLARHIPSCCGLSIEEYKRKHPNAPIRAICVDKKISDAYKNPNSGYNTAEHKEVRRKRALKNWSDGGRWRTEGNRIRRSKAVSKAMRDPDSYFQSDEARRKRSQTLRKRWMNPKDGIGSEEANRGRSESMMTLWEDPSSNMNTPEANAKRSAVISKIWNLPDSPYRTEECREKRSLASKARWERGVFDGVFQSPTSIEIEVMEALDKLGLKHISQWSPDGYSRVYDELVYPNILIEVQGSYWHSTKEQQDKDLEKARWAHNNGYKFIAIWDFHLEQYGADFLVEKWILPLNPKVGMGKMHYMPRLF